jgi:hypothetical protein
MVVVVVVVVVWLWLIAPGVIVIVIVTAIRQSRSQRQGDQWCRALIAGLAKSDVLERYGGEDDAIFWYGGPLIQTSLIYPRK